MADRTFLQKTGKWIAGILLFLVLALTGVSLWINAKWKPLLSEKIKQVVHDGSSGLYHISFKDLHLNLLTGSLTADSILLAPDTAVFHALRRQGAAPAHLFRVRLERLRLRNISIREVYFHKKIDMNDIILEQPSINMIYNRVSRQNSKPATDKSLYELISGSLRSVHINAIALKDADFSYVSGATGEVLHQVKKLDIRIKDLLIDKSAATDSTRFYYTKDVFFSLAGYSALSKNKMYTQKADSITASATGQTIILKGFRMIPMYPELQFSRMMKTQKDRYNLLFPEIRLSGVDFLKLNAEGVLHAAAMQVRDARVKVFMNREMPPGQANKGNNFPHMALQRLPLQTTIDTLKLQGISVAYTEYNPMSQEKGTVHIDHLGGNILNVTNDSLSLSRNHHALARLSAQMIRAAQLDIRINFDLAARNGAFTFAGNIGPMDMTKLNPLSKALGLVKIEQGQIHKIDFDVQANEKGSHGIMHLYYDHLKVALLKEGEDGQPVKKKGLLSFLANTLIIKDANPAKGQALRTGKIEFQRPPGASFFNLLWKSVFIGMRETVGLGIIPMKSPAKGRAAVVKKLEERKEKKAERREKVQEKKSGKH